MKRLISLLLAAVLLLGTFAAAPTEVHAARELKASDNIIELIKYFEGFVAKAKWDNSQYTIGYGTACDPKDYPNGITKAEAEVLLREAVEEFENHVNKFANNNKLVLSQHQFDALLSFTYNLGPGWLNSSSTLRTAVLSGKKGNDFLYGITMWCVAGAEGQKQVLSNLVRRRLIEANVYLNGVYSQDVPANYDYVLFENNISEPSNTVRIQGYDSSLTDSVRPKPTKSGYRFLGWYTSAEGGEWVTTLNSNTAGKTLYGHWQKGNGTGEGVAAKYKRVTTAEVIVFDTVTNKEIKRIPAGTTVTVTADYMDSKGVKWGKAEGGWINLSETAPVGGSSGGNSGSNPGGNPGSSAGTIIVTVNTDGVNIRKGPGTSYEKVGKANKGDVLAITKVQQGSNYTWGQFSKGWICLDYTDYDQVIAGGSADGHPVTGVVVKTDKLNIRNKPGTSGTTIVGSYARGDVITITQQQKLGSTTWGKTDKGWVSLYYVELNTGSTGGSGDSGDSGNSGGSTGTTDKVIATGTVTDCIILKVRKGPGTGYQQVGGLAAGTWVQIYEKTAHGSQIWGRIDQGWICLDYVELDVEVGDDENAVNGVIYNCDRVNVRKGPGTNYEKVAKLAAGTKLQIFETTTVKGVKWGRMSLGWVCMDYVKLDGTDSEPEKPDTGDTGNSGSTGGNTGNTGSGESGGNSGTTGGNTGTTVKTGIIVKTTELRIRAGAGTQYEQVGTLKKGDRVVILETAKVGDATWARIEKGWIHMYYVQLEETEVPDGTITRTVTTELRIRAGAGTNYEKVGTYQKGDVVMIYEQTTVKGRPWGRTDRGWICLEYVK